MVTRPPPSQPRPATPAPSSTRKFTRTSGVIRKAWRLGLYGPGGVGKSTLVSTCPNIAVADIEHSTEDLNLSRVDGITVTLPDGTVDMAASWINLRAWIQSVTPAEYKTIGIDSITRAEDWCTAYVIKYKKSSEGNAAKDSLEDYKYKAGLIFVTDEFKRFLSDIDGAFLRGVNVVMIAHNRTAKFKNADGSDYVRIEPRLLHTDDKGSNMLAWIESLDHLGYIDMDTAVDKGKAKSGGSRTIHFENRPNRLAKTRYLTEVEFELVLGETKLWEMLSAGGGQ